MKILSLWQPWASLWVAGAGVAKGIETRSWGTSYRGPVAVHAAKHWDEDLAALCRTEPFKSVLERLGYTDAPMGHRACLPFGKILGRVDLVMCLPMKAIETRDDRWAVIRSPNEHEDYKLTPNEYLFGHYAPGRFAWVTGEARHILAEPIPFRGAQGLRDLPADIAARLA